jgi:hypothetical protein
MDVDGVGESRRCKSRWDIQLAQLMGKVYEELHETTLSKPQTSLLDNEVNHNAF